MGMLIPKPGMDITMVVIPDITEDTVDTTDTPTDHTHIVTTENAPLLMKTIPSTHLSKNAQLMLPLKPPLKLMLMPLPGIMVDTMDTPDTTDMDTDTDTVWDIDHTTADTMVWDTVDTTGARRRMSVTIPSQFV